MKQYGISGFQEINDGSLEANLEDIKRKGYTVLRNMLSKKEVIDYSTRLEKVNKNQEASFKKERLQKINEMDVVRMPFVYDDSFVDLIQKPEILNVVEEILGENYILHLQNGVINRCNKEHHQSSWHRDIPYQEYIVSNPISVNVFYCLSPFNEKTGGTIFLPYSHLFPKAPSVSFINNNLIQPKLNEGDVIIFDSWLFHKAGYNSSDIIRYGLNQVYTTPILKQQINIPVMLQGRFKESSKLAKILGYTFDITSSVDEYRRKRLNKITIND